MEARRRTHMVLAVRYPEEYRELFAAELAGLTVELGPLPGDEVQP